MVKLIAADMDGTLLDSQKRLPRRFAPLLERLRGMGVHFAVASGRQYYNLLEQFPGLHDEIAFISENGAMVVERGATLYIDRIEPETVADRVAAIREIDGACPVLCGVKSAYFDSADQEAFENIGMYYARAEKLGDILTALEKDTIFKIAVYDRLGAEANSFPVLTANPAKEPARPLPPGIDPDELTLGPAGLSVILSGAHWVDLMNPGVNKGTALRMLEQAYGLDYRQTMAFGDYLNDYEMIRACSHGYAMANAHPKLLSAARYIAKSNDEDGVVDAICRHFGIDPSALD